VDFRKNYSIHIDILQSTMLEIHNLRKVIGTVAKSLHAQERGLLQSNFQRNSYAEGGLPSLKELLLGLKWQQIQKGHIR